MIIRRINMATRTGTIGECLDEFQEAEANAYTSISPKFKKQIKIAEARVKKAEAELDQTRERAEISMNPVLREKYLHAHNALVRANEAVFERLDRKRV